ncbi:MAG: ABC transporter ATP-binding protein [Clostridiales bacterium]|jgi:iron complex transport system ATP-binding protein|nr:ABC transporter ATP-binding protein [Clostridiales bacterium]
MINVKDLNFSYGKSCRVLSQIAFEANEGQCIAVLGNNGAGKSTMIKCLNRILQPQEGTVVVNGRDIQRLKRQKIAQDMAYVAQQNESAQFTVYDAVLLGRKPYIKLNPTEEDHKITKDILKRMGLESFSLRYLDELSGGELQKVMLARALAQQPKVLMLDEPTSNLDLKNQYEVLRIIRDIAIEDRICVIIVIHDLNLALRYCDRFMFIKDSSVYSLGDINTVNSETISEVYGMNVAIENIRGYQTVVPICG